MESKIVGILGQIFIACTLTGGGQLGRMLAAAATRLNIDVVILETGENSPAKQVVSSPHIGHVDGSFSDPAKIRELASKVDILTVEIEHVNVSILEEIQSSTSVQVHPSPATIRTIQDKYLQKQHLQAHGIAVADFTEVESTPSGVELAGELLDWPLMLKSKTLAYDGRGNYVLKSISEAHSAISALGNRPLYAERLMPLKKEIAVMVVRSLNGEIASYPAVETIHKDNICHLVYAPLRQVSPDVTRRAKMLAENAVRTFGGAGIFGVEMFLLDDDTLLVNEIAPRPHNSGHYTIEACYTSQYENHLRAILSLPLGSTSMKVHSSIMLNLLGTTNDMKDITRVAQKALKIPGASVHLYGKKECRKGRKMGHITLTAESDAEIRERLRPLLEELPDATSESITQQAPLVPPPKSGKSAAFPLVGIIMGSDSDLPVMLPAARILDDFRVPYELTIVSAHRTPDRMTIYAREAASRGLRAIIAGAGGAAHLPGMVAAMTSLPVIGVPVKGSSLDGVDSLHSIVQMPRGIPVATVAINNSTNAALLAVRILASHSEQYLKAMDKYSKDLENQVMGKVEKLGEVGWETYRP